MLLCALNSCGGVLLGGEKPRTDCFSFRCGLTWRENGCIFGLFGGVASECVPISVMVAGVISWQGKPHLVFVEPGHPLYAQEYRNILKTVFIPELYVLFREQWNFEWVQV